MPRVVKSEAPEGVRIFSEVGRNLVEDVFDLETRVVSVKSYDSGTLDVVIDANIMHFPCFWEKKYNIEHTPEEQQGAATTVNIFGNSCMQIDKIAENFLMRTKPKVGDRITLTKMGAYSVSQASNFITAIPPITAL